jgi:hypothetical protein
MQATHPYAGSAGRWLTRTKGEIHSYQDAEDFLGDEDERNIGANMVIVRRVDGIAVKLYDTDIIIYYPDETFKADNGGFRTPTTVNRLNQFGPKGWNFAHEKKRLTAWRHGETHICPCRLPVFTIHDLRAEVALST